MPRISPTNIRILSLVVLLLLWQIAALIANSRVLPTPSHVLATLWYELYEGELLYHLAITLTRVAISFICAMLIGTAVGILMGNRRLWDQLLDTLLVLGLNIPALVTIILCYIWFGLGEVAAILAVTLNKIPTVITIIREGSRAIDKELMQVAMVYRLSPSDTFRKVYLPQLYPYIFAAGRNGLSLIWKIVLVVELIGRSNGVGFQLSTFFQFFDISSILAYTIAFAMVVLSLEALLVRPLETRLNRWRYDNS